LDNFVERHPEAVYNLTSILSEKLSSLLTPSHSTEEAPPEAPATVSAPRASPHPALEADAQGMEKGRKADALVPWAFAGGSMLAAVACAGVAMGAFCHAQLSSERRRDLTPALLATQHPGEVEAPVAVEEAE